MGGLGVWVLGFRMSDLGCRFGLRGSSGFQVWAKVSYDVKAYVRLLSPSLSLEV